jgi:hypothetical protein
MYYNNINSILKKYQDIIKQKVWFFYGKKHINN